MRYASAIGSLPGGGSAIIMCIAVPPAAWCATFRDLGGNCTRARNIFDGDHDEADCAKRGTLVARGRWCTTQYSVVDALARFLKDCGMDYNYNYKILHVQTVIPLMQHVLETATRPFPLV